MFWLRQGILAGSAGPNRTVWEIDTLVKHQVQGVLSLNDGALIREDDLSAASIAYKRLSLPDNAPPEAQDYQICASVLPQAMEFVQRTVDAGGAALVHCSAGKDRTGLFLSYYLCQTERLSPEDAIDAVKAIRPEALSAPGWVELTRKLLGDSRL